MEGVRILGQDIPLIILSLLVFVLTYVALLFVLHSLKKILSKYAERTKTKLDDVILSALEKTSKIFLLVPALAGALLFINVPEFYRFVVQKTLILVFFLQVALWLVTGVNRYVELLKEEKDKYDPTTLTTFSALGFVSKILIWTGAFLLILDNFGVKITTFIAGLGIGGVAIALAVQNILSDLFASLSIIFDKPFVIGDFIVVGDFSGTVEHIGLKTTRIRSLTGEQIVVSNTDLLGSRIRNFKRMDERRITFQVGVTYETPIEKLEKIPDIIRSIIEKQPHTRFDRVHFKSFGDFALVYEIVYYMTKPDYVLYMDTQQNINLEIMKAFEKEGIEFAYPTQFLYVHPVESEEKT